MSTGDKRTAKVVIVPDVLGERFLRGRDIAFTAGLTLANPDPEGPPISALVWPNDPIIQRQDPAPGRILYEHDSLRVWLSSDLEPDLTWNIENPPPSVDSAHAIAEKLAQTIDLTGDNSGDETAP